MPPAPRISRTCSSRGPFQKNRSSESARSLAWANQRARGGTALRGPVQYCRHCPAILPRLRSGHPTARCTRESDGSGADQRSYKTPPRRAGSDFRSRMSVFPLRARSRHPMASRTQSGRHFNELSAAWARQPLLRRTLYSKEECRHLRSPGPGRRNIAHIISASATLTTTTSAWPSRNCSESASPH